MYSVSLHTRSEMTSLVGSAGGEDLGGGSGVKVGVGGAAMSASASTGPLTSTVVSDTQQWAMISGNRIHHPLSSALCPSSGGASYTMGDG